MAAAGVSRWSATLMLVPWDAVFWDVQTLRGHCEEASTRAYFRT
jgi:hypothetical protein